MRGHIGPLFPMKSELWYRGRVPGRREPSGAASSCPEVWEYSQELGWGRLVGRELASFAELIPRDGTEG